MTHPDRPINPAWLRATHCVEDCRMPTRLGCKNPRHIQAIFVTNIYPGGYWEGKGCNGFGGS